MRLGRTTDSEGGDDVGRFDMILVSNKTASGAPMEWCAVEIQAVYFSGDAMLGEFIAYADATWTWSSFLPERRDRTIAAVATKAPDAATANQNPHTATLGQEDGRRGGPCLLRLNRRKWIALRIFQTLTLPGSLSASMRRPVKRRSHMVLDEVRLTTLERSVEGLTGGKPVPKQEFERQSQSKLEGAPTRAEADAIGAVVPEEVPEQN